MEMATEGHEHGGRGDHQQMSKAEIDKELTEIRARMEELALKMQQSAKARWVYEWPMKKKVKWPVKELLAKRQQRLLKIWLRYVESLSDTELVCICEPEVGETLSDEEERSVSGLINCQEGRDEFSNCQVGNEMRSLEDLIDCQEDSSGNSYCQEGNGMRLAEDLVNCQVGRAEIPYCQVGKGEQMRLSESLMNSGMSSGQQGVLMKMGSIDLINCQVGRSELSSCQVGNGKRSVEGLAYCQGSSGESSDCQVGNEMGSLWIS
jgi:hypothetical protein